jgi:hypothetical protein
MKIRLAMFSLLILLGGCATFKELEPAPPIQPGERGFIELRNDKENFQLKRDDKYFIMVPRPSDMHYLLVLQTNAKQMVHNYFTSTFHDGEPPIIPITDQAAQQDSTSVFAVDTSEASYFWVIDTVYQDMPLTVRYRYVPQWRYTVENKYDQYRKILADNSIDRSAYEAMGPQFDFASFNTFSELKKLQQCNKQLSAMNDELLKLEGVFPANIASSKDTMYQRYVTLKDETDGELKFQSDYGEILTTLLRENETKGRFDAFIARAPEFEKILQQKDRFRAPVLDYFKSVYIKRLGEALTSYDAQLQKKDDLSKVSLVPPLADVQRLYAACGEQMPAELNDVGEFVKEFNSLSDAVKGAESAYEAAYSAMQRRVDWPEDTYYPNLISKLDAAKFPSPENSIGKFKRYKDLKITVLLSKGASTLMLQMDQLERRYRKASEVVRQINTLRPTKNYSGIIQILRANRDLDFVLAQYSDIDALQLNSRTEKIRSWIAANEWKTAETGLSNLQADKDYLSISQISAKKLQAVQTLEEQLFERVKSLSFARVDAFAKSNDTTLTDVPHLYEDSVFLPVYNLTYSSESPGRVLQRKRTIDAYLNNVKFIQFPEKAIRIIYKELTRSPRDRGVEKARAILAHGKYYKGRDKTIRNIVDECDPTIAKTLTKPKEYRRLLVIPVNESPSASNEYLFRVNVKIPSDAMFPVFDVNIKVPSEVAENAGENQWFSEMTLNKKAIKTEGHMRIVAPSADNNYEAQVTPVQMAKNKDNIIQIRFKYPKFQLFEVSVMAQVPLIRKN